MRTTIILADTKASQADNNIRPAKGKHL